MRVLVDENRVDDVLVEDRVARGGKDFEVVAAETEKFPTRRGARGGGDGSDSDDDSDDDASSSAASSADPRNEAYDSDTHAELLALGKLLKKHTTAKKLVDASYNRYAFDEAPDSLPSWFSSDESRHFKPQLPITKAEVDAIKARFRDIST